MQLGNERGFYKKNFTHPSKINTVNDVLRSLLIVDLYKSDACTNYAFKTTICIPYRKMNVFFLYFRLIGYRSIVYVHCISYLVALLAQLQIPILVTVVYIMFD